MKTIIQRHRNIKSPIGKNASLKSLRRYCKELWSEYVKERDGRKCVICGEEKFLNAHHLITAKCQHTRFETDCGISLCPKCHIFGIASAHCSPWVMYEWLQKNGLEQAKWVEEHKNKIYDTSITPDIEFYRNNLKKLLSKFEKNYPTPKKRNKYYKFLEQEEESIILYYNKNEKETIISLAKKFNCNYETIKGILKRNNIKIRKVEGKDYCINITAERKKELKDMKIKLYGKKVQQFDLKRNLINAYPSIYEASRQTGILANSIRNNIHGLSKTAGNYIWEKG